MPTRLGTDGSASTPRRSVPIALSGNSTKGQSLQESMSFTIATTHRVVRLSRPMVFQMDIYSWGPTPTTMQIVMPKDATGIRARQFVPKDTSTPKRTLTSIRTDIEHVGCVMLTARERSGAKMARSARSTETRPTVRMDTFLMRPTPESAHQKIGHPAGIVGRATETFIAVGTSGMKTESTRTRGYYLVRSLVRALVYTALAVLLTAAMTVQWFK